MLKVSLRNLLVNKLRLLLTIAAVTVGVTFVSGTFVLSDTMVKAFDELYTGLTSGTDVVVKSEAAYEADITTTGGQVRPLDEDIVTRCARSREWQSRVGLRLRARPGQERRPDPARWRPRSAPASPPTRGSRVPPPSARAHASSGAHEVADARTAKKAGYELGDSVDVVLQDGRRTFTLVAIIGLGRPTACWAPPGRLRPATAQQALGKDGVVDEVDVMAADGVSARELRDRIAGVLPDGVEALTGAGGRRQHGGRARPAGIFTTVLLVFAGVSVVVGSFVIWNTFNVLVAQRRRGGVAARGRSDPSAGARGVLIEADDRSGLRRPRSPARRRPRHRHPVAARS